MAAADRAVLVARSDAHAIVGVFEPGNLERYDLATRSVTPIWFGRQAGGANYPSVGNRYGAAWGNDYKDFEIVDLARAQPVLVRRPLALLGPPARLIRMARWTSSAAATGRWASRGDRSVPSPPDPALP